MRMKGGFTQRCQLAMHRVRKTLAANNAAGFTVIEVLIVLAVTGGLFISAALLISGRQDATQFQQAINNVKTQIQQVISDVDSGFYPPSNFTCTANGAGGIAFTNPVQEQGTNQDCVFLGKVLQFGVQNSDPEQFYTYAIAGLRQNPDGTEVVNYTQASPTVVTTNAANPTGNPSARNLLQYGLKTYSMKYTSNGVTSDIGSVGFMNTLATYNNGLAQGAENVMLAPIGSSTRNATPAQAVTQINAATGLKATPLTQPSDLSVAICFASGGTDQSGLITIGSNGRQLSVTLSIKAGRKC